MKLAILTGRAIKIFRSYFLILSFQFTVSQDSVAGINVANQTISAHSRANHFTKQTIDDFLKETVSQQPLAVKAHFNILARTDNPDAYQDLKSKESTVVRKMDATPNIEGPGAPQPFWAGIQGNEANFPYNETLLSFLEPCCSFLNFETIQKSSTSPIGMRLGERLYGRPLKVDISDESLKKGPCVNRNKFILGASGSGKSFFTNHVLHSYHQQGSPILLIDVRHSYQGLCKLLKGCYFTYDSSDPFCFNPFLIANYTEVSKDKKESLKTLMLALWKNYGQSYSRNEGITLSNGIVQASARNTLTYKVNSSVNSTSQQLYNNALSLIALRGVNTSSNWEKLSYGQSASDSYQDSYLKDKIQNQN